MLGLIAVAFLYDIAPASPDSPILFRIDATASRVWFDADARLHSFRGETRQVTGHFRLQQHTPPQLAEATVSIDAASLETGNTERDADMRRDFLEVQRFPTIELRGEELLTPHAAAKEASWDVILHGQLTVHGVTRPVKIPMAVSLSAEHAVARGHMHLDMRDYQIRVPRLLLIPMKSEVLVGFEVTARRDR
jgi:polyisoprenoid-binding protein YceI